MRVAFVNGTHIWSGVKTWCLDNAELLREQGHFSIIYGRAGAFIDKAHQLGLDAIPCTFGVEFNPLSIYFFYKEFKRLNIDLCVCNVSKDMHSAGIAAKLLGIPIVQHLGAVGDLRKSRRKFATIQILKPYFVTPSEFVKKGLLAKLPALAKYELMSIHPGCPVAPSPRTQVGSPRVLTITSRLAPGKGHDIILNACEKLKAEGYDSRCVIVGSGECGEAIRALCTKKSLNDIVTFAGFVTNIQEHLAASDIYLFPATNEGLGIALEEAIASGMPCIAKAGSGPEEIWPPERRSMLIPENDNGEALYLQIKRLLDMDDKTLLAEARIFHEFAKKYCDRKIQAQELASWFENILARH